MNLTYAPAQKDDIEPLFQLNRDLIDRYENTSRIDYAKVLLWVRNKIETHIGEYICIFMGNGKVGYYYFHPAERKMELDDLYVLPPYRGRGIGSKIIRKCIDETNLPIFLYVFVQNSGAVSLYKRFGFRITETIRGSRYIMEK